MPEPNDTAAVIFSTKVSSLRTTKYCGITQKSLVEGERFIGDAAGPDQQLCDIVRHIFRRNRSLCFIDTILSKYINILFVFSLGEQFYGVASHIFISASAKEQFTAW